MRTYLVSLVRRLLRGRAAGLPASWAGRRLLFVQLETALGTAVNATPVFAAIRTASPETQLNVVASGLTYELHRHSPRFTEVLNAPHPRKGYWRTACWFAWHLRRRRRDFDCVVLDSGNRRFGIDLLAWLSGIPHRVGFAHDRDLHHRSIPHRPDQSVMVNNLALVPLLLGAPAFAEPELFPSAADRAWAAAFCIERGIRPGASVVAIQTQTSGGQPNAWYDDRFALVARDAVDRHDAEVVFVGTAGDRPAITAIQSMMGRPSHSAAGRTTVGQLAALLERCRLLVTPDTGTMHVGRAVRVPMVIIANAANPRHEWLPEPSPHISILRFDSIPCAGCRLCYCSHRACMDGISSAEVSIAIDTHLRPGAANSLQIK